MKGSKFKKQILVRFSDADLKRIDQIADKYEGIIDRAKFMRYATLKLIEYAEKHGGNILDFGKEENKNE